MAIKPAGPPWGKGVLGFLWAAPALARTTLTTWIFATTNAEGLSARNAAGVKFALTTANGNYARSAVGVAFASIIVKDHCAKIVVAVAFALTIASGLFARSVVAAAFAVTIAKGRIARSAEAVVFAHTVADGTVVQRAKLKPEGNMESTLFTCVHSDMCKSRVPWVLQVPLMLAFIMSGPYQDIVASQWKIG